MSAVPQHYARLIANYFFGLACDSALAAADLLALLVRPSRRTLEAIEATLWLVCLLLCFAIMPPHFLLMMLILYNVIEVISTCSANYKFANNILRTCNDTGRERGVQYDRNTNF